MAKKEKEQPDQEEMQIPEKPKNKSGSMSMPMILGIIGGIVIFQAIIIFLLFKFLIVPQQPVAEAEVADKEHTEKVEDDEEAIDDENWTYDEFSLDEKLVQLFETGRITTNPRNSDKFVIIDIAIIYIIRNEDVLEELEQKLAEEGGGHGGEDEVPSFFSHKKQIIIKGKINSILGSYTAEELFSQRDSLPSIFQLGLEPLINNSKMKVKELIVQEFIIQ